MKKFEYTHRRNVDEVDLNIMGKNGWELVAVIVPSPTQLMSPVHFYFKREITE